MYANGINLRKDECEVLGFGVKFRVFAQFRGHAQFRGQVFTFDIRGYLKSAIENLAEPTHLHPRCRRYDFGQE